MRVVLVDGTTLDTSDAASGQPSAVARGAARRAERAGGARAGRRAAHAAHPQEVLDQEHHRLLDQRAGAAAGRRTLASCPKDAPLGLPDHPKAQAAPTRSERRRSRLPACRPQEPASSRPSVEISAWRDQADSPEDPIEILKQLMIGSEGTLGFVAGAPRPRRGLAAISMSSPLRRLQPCDARRSPRAARATPSRADYYKTVQAADLGLEVQAARGRAPATHGRGLPVGADHRYKASAFLVFPDIGDACDATTVLRQQTSVDAVEIFDRRSLKLCAEMEPMARPPGQRAHPLPCLRHRPLCARRPRPRPLRHCSAPLASIASAARHRPHQG